MNEQAAAAVADALEGETWQFGGDVHLVILRRQDGAVVSISKEVVLECADEEAFEAGEARISIFLH